MTTGTRDNMKRWPLIVAIVMLLSTWGSLQLLSHGEPILTKKPFAEFPLTITDRWQGKELGMEQSVLDILKLTDYMMRVYVPQSAGEKTVPLWLYVGYYQSQRTGGDLPLPEKLPPGCGLAVRGHTASTGTGLGRHHHHQ